MGRRDDTTPAQAYAWINEYKPGSRQFFFTASHPEDIADDNNQAMLYNAVFWVLKLEVPHEGVIASFDGKLLKESVPYRQSTHSIQPVPPLLETNGITGSVAKSLGFMNWMVGHTVEKAYRIFPGHDGNG